MKRGVVGAVSAGSSNNSHTYSHHVAAHHIPLAYAIPTTPPPVGDKNALLVQNVAAHVRKVLQKHEKALLIAIIVVICVAGTAWWFFPVSTGWKVPSTTEKPIYVDYTVFTLTSAKSVSNPLGDGRIKLENVLSFRICCLVAGNAGHMECPDARDLECQLTREGPRIECNWVQKRLIDAQCTVYWAARS